MAVNVRETHERTIELSELRSMVGTEIGVSDWFLIDQDMINQFAKLTGDDQFHHVDVVRAKDSPFGGTIAHGMLTLSLLRAMYERSNAPGLKGTKAAISYGANKLRFTAPVRSGKRVRGHFKLVSLEQKSSNAVMQTFEFLVEVEDENRPALIAEWLIQITL
jgi:acyl dehydratase